MTQVNATRSPVPVAYVYVTLATGGAERHLATLLAHLDRERYAPHVLCLSEVGAIGEQIRATGVPLRDFALPRKRLWLPGGLLRVARYLRRNGIRIAHTHMYHANTYGRLAALLAGVPHVVATVHTTGGHPRRKQRLMNRLLDRHTDRIVVVSEAARQALLAEGATDAAKTVVIRNGVDLARFRGGAPRTSVREALGVPPGATVVTAVARLEPEKRHHDLLRAFRDVAADARHVHLLIAGDGSLREVIAQQVRDLGLQDCVSLLGERRDVPGILGATDLFVLPSEREGAPLAVLEAMAAGVPVVASAVGGVPEMVGDEAGILYPPGDTAALAAALRALLANPGRRARMGDAAARRAALEFSAEEMALRVEEVYARIIAAPSDPA